MKHHFADVLYRELGHWKMTPNHARHVYSITHLQAISDQITIVTIGKNDANWQIIPDLPKLEELTLHNPSKEQLATLGDLDKVKRLRLTHCRPSELTQLARLANVEELVLEYVSGFSDLSPIAQMPSLRALHLENLRGVEDFGPLSKARQLRHLSIRGTLDWTQPVQDFAFLATLEKLEALRLWQIRCLASSPALIAATRLKKLKHIGIAPNIFQTIDYALMEIAHPDVDGAKQVPVQVSASRYLPLPVDDIRSKLPKDVIKARHPEVVFTYQGRGSMDPEHTYYAFLGKGQRIIPCNYKTAAQRREQHQAHYDDMLQEARRLLRPT